MGKTYLHASFVNQRTGKVRHILIDEVTGPGFTDLIQFTDGIEETIASGTEYETRQKADLLGQMWVKEEGFTWAKDDSSPHEQLEHAVKLAMRLGNDAIFDPRLVQTDLRKPNFNATGLVLLKEWSGVQAKNGGSYKYAVTLSAIIASPQPPPNYALPASLSVSQQYIELHKVLESVGSQYAFRFAGMTLVP